MNGQYRRISVIDPLNPTLSRVEDILFSPFDMGKWFVIGFCAWLAYLGSGPGANLNIGRWEQGGGDVGVFLRENLYWILPVGIMVLLVGVLIGLVVLWLSSRGRFMFLHCVATNQGQVKDPWRRYAAHGNSLFFFRLVLGIVGAVVVLLAAGGVAVAVAATHALRAMPLVVLALVVGVLVLLPLAVVLGAIGKLTEDFVVPIMYLETSSCLCAWGRFMEQLKAHFGMIVLYLLFQIVLAMAIGVLLFVVVMATCCVACCILMIPYVGTVLLLPVLVFKRSYSLYFLQQFGPEFDVFSRNAVGD